MWCNRDCVRPSCPLTQERTDRVRGRRVLLWMADGAGVCVCVGKEWDGMGWGVYSKGLPGR